MVEAFESDARVQAQVQWNVNPCGAVDGDPSTLEYFDRVETVRYAQQSWQHHYFKFERYRGKHVLEIGCGHGTDLLQFAKAGALCHVVDITDAHLSLTARNFSLRGLSVDLHKADATRLPFDDGSLDVVYSFGVIHHIPDIEKVLTEVRRVLKPSGKFLCAVYYKWSAFHLTAKILGDGLYHGRLFKLGYAGLLSTIETGADGIQIKPYVRLYSKRGMRRLLNRAGFVIDDVSVWQLEYASFWPTVLSRVAMRYAASLQSRLGWYVAVTATKPS